MSAPTPAAPPMAPPPLRPKLPFLGGYDFFIHHIKQHNPGLDNLEAHKKSAEYWNVMTPSDRMLWDKLAADAWDTYTRDILLLMNGNPNSSASNARMRTSNIERCQYCNCNTAHYSLNQGAATAQDAMAQGATSQGTTTQGATVQGATVQGATVQGATAQGDTVQGATAQGATAQGVTAQGAPAQGATVQGATVQGATAQGATAQGATVQGATAQGATAQGVTAQGAPAQGATVQGATVQGATAQGATAQRVTAQGAPALDATSRKVQTQTATILGYITQRATAPDYMGQGATALSYMGQRATAQGATGQGARAQGATALGYMGQRATAQGATGQGARVQGATALGYMGQRATAQGYWAQALRAQHYRTPEEMAATSGLFNRGSVYLVVIPRNLAMETGASYKSYLYYGNDPKPEVRRFYLSEIESYKFAPLQSMVREIYQLKSQKFSIAWKDEDGDEVLMSSDAEVRTMQSEGQDGVLKLVVRCENNSRAQKPSEARESPAVAGTSGTNQGGIPGGLHRGVTCDGCDQAVIGHRYKCISCDNYDLCAKCETAGKHSEHCVVRVPFPIMSVPLLKATIKKSRRFLKSVALSAIEENKKLRRERRQSAEPNTQGKPDSQPRTSIGWMDAFNKYMEEFANIAGNMSYCPATETATTEAATSTEPRSGETDMNVPTDHGIAHNPWSLSGERLTALQRACKYMRENNIADTTNQAVKFFASLDPAAHAFAPEMDLKNGASNLTQDEKDIAEAGPSPRQEAKKPEADPEPQKSPNTYQGVGNPEQAPTQAALSDSAKMAQITITGQGTPESASFDISELANAVNKCEMSSNASSCSEGNGYEKAEGWTVVDAETLLKDENPDAAAEEEEGPMEVQEPIRQQASLYPPLNTATAVFDPKETDVTASASAPPAPAARAPTAPAATARAATARAATARAATTPAATAPAQAAPTNTTKLTEQEVKRATSASAAIAADLRMQIAPHVEAALQQMEMMGFSNESGWLTQLLDHHDGNIAIVLDLIAPVKGSNAPNARGK